jgi:hypothetical protein
MIGRAQNIEMGVKDELDQWSRHELSLGLHAFVLTNEQPLASTLGASISSSSGAARESPPRSHITPVLHFIHQTLAAAHGLGSIAVGP